MSEAYDLGSFEEFDQKMNSPESREKLWKYIDGDGRYDIGDFNHFDEAMRPVEAQTVSPTTQAPVSLGTQQGTAAELPQPTEQNKQASEEYPQPYDVNGNVLTNNGEPYSQEMLKRYYSPENKAGNFKDLATIAAAVEREQSVSRMQTTSGAGYIPEHPLNAEGEQKAFDEEMRRLRANSIQGEEYRELYGKFDEAFRNGEMGGKTAYAQANALADEMGLDNGQKYDILGRINRQYARERAAEAVQSLMEKMPDRSVDPLQALQGQYYDRDLQQQLMKTAATMGNDYQDYVNMFVKPQLIEAMKQKYGGTDQDWSGVRGLFSNWQHVGDRLETQEVGGLLSQHFAPAIDEAIGKAFDEALGVESELQQSGAMSPQFSTGNMASLVNDIVAKKKGNEIRDPKVIRERFEKALFGDSSGDTGGNGGGSDDRMLNLAVKEILTDENLSDEILARADKSGMTTIDYIRKYVIPQMRQSVSSQFEKAFVEREMPKSTAEYILKGLTDDNIIMMLANRYMRTEEQQRISNEADALTASGENPSVDTSTWTQGARLATGMAADFWLWTGWGRLGAKATGELLSQRVAARAAADHITEEAARRLIEEEGKQFLGKGVVEGMMRHIPQSAVTMSGAEATATAVQGIRDREDAAAIIGNTFGSAVSGATTGTLFGVTGGAMGRLTSRLSGPARLAGKLAGFGVEASTMYTAEELQKMAQGEDAFQNPFDGLIEASIKLGFIKASANPLATGARLIEAVRHPVKSAKAAMTPGNPLLSEDDVKDIMDSQDGSALMDALTRMRPARSTDKGEREGYIGEADAEIAADAYRDFMTNPDRPWERKQKVAHLLGGLLPPPGHEVRTEIVDTDGGNMLRTRDLDGNLIRETRYDSHDAALEAADRMANDLFDNTTAALRDRINTAEAFSRFNDYFNQAYAQAADKMAKGLELTKAEQQAVYLHQHGDELLDIYKKIEAGEELSEDGKNLADLYRQHFEGYVMQNKAASAFTGEYEQTNGLTPGTIDAAIKGHTEAEAKRLAEQNGEGVYQTGDTWRTQGEQDVINGYQQAMRQRIAELEGEGIAVENAPNSYRRENNLLEDKGAIDGIGETEGTENSVENTGGTNTLPPNGTNGGYGYSEGLSGELGSLGRDREKRREVAYQKGMSVADDESQLPALAYEQRKAAARLFRLFPGNDPVAARVRNGMMQAVQAGDTDAAESLLQQSSSMLTEQQREALEQYLDTTETQTGIEDAAVSHTEAFEERRREELKTIADSQGNVTGLLLNDGSTVYYQSGDLDNHYGGVMAIDANGQPVQVAVRSIKEVGIPMSIDDILNSETETFYQQLIQHYGELMEGMPQAGQQVEMILSGQPLSATMTGQDGSGNPVFQLEDGSMMPLRADEAMQAIAAASQARMQQELQAEEEADALRRRTEQFRESIAGFAEGQPDLSAEGTDAKVAAEYVRSQFGTDGQDAEKARKQYIEDIQSTKEQMSRRLGDAQKEIARLNQWIAGNEDIADAQEVEQTRQRIAELEAAVNDIGLRQQKWGEIRRQLMTPEELNQMEQQRRREVFNAEKGYQPQLPQRNLTTDEERITLEDGRQNFGATPVGNVNNYLLKHFEDSIDADKFINSQRIALRNRQRDEVQAEINRRNEQLNAYVSGYQELTADDVSRLAHEVADLEALQQALSDEAIRLRQIAEGIPALYERNHPQRLTPSEQRSAELEKATDRESKRKIAQRVYADNEFALGIVSDQEPKTVEEYIAQSLPIGILNWEGYDRGERHINGVRDAVFGKKGATRGIGKGYSTNAFNMYLAPEGKGKGFDEVVHSLYEDGPEVDGRKLYDDTQIGEALINMLLTAQKPSDISHLLINNRIAEAEAIVRQEEEREREAEEEARLEELEAWADFYHLTPEERETFEDFLQQPPTEIEEDIINQIIADNEQNQTSPEMGGQPVGGETAAGIEGGEGQVQQAGEAASNGNTGQEAGSGAEAGTDQPASADDNVPGAAQGAFERGVDDLARIEDEWRDRILNYVYEHYPTQATVSAETDSPKGKAEREMMKNDPVYREMLRQQKEAVNAADQKVTEAYTMKKTFSKRLEKAKAETDVNPTDAQKKAGNYRMGHIKFGGYSMSIENPKGSTRSGIDRNRKPWSIDMKDTYGYIGKKYGTDGDHLDFFINDDADLDTFDGRVYVVDQKNEDGTFDEHKVMYGYPSWSAARKAYERNYEPGWWSSHVMQMTGVRKADFDKWLGDSDHKTKPFAEYYRTRMADTVSSPVDQLLSDISDREEAAAIREADRDERQRAMERLRSEPTTPENVLQRLSDAYKVADDGILRDIADDLREFVRNDNEVAIPEDIDPDVVEEYDGDDPQMLALQYIVRLSRHYYTDYDEDIPYIVTGRKSPKGRPAVPESIRYDVESFLVNDRKLSKGELRGEELAKVMRSQSEMAERLQPMLARLSDKQLEQTVKALEDFKDTAPVIAVEMEQERRAEKREAIDQVMGEVEKRKQNSLTPVQPTISESDLQYMDEDQLVQRRHKAKADLHTSADLLATNDRIKPGGKKYEQLMKNILQAEADINVIDEELEKRANFDQYDYQIEEGKSTAVTPTEKQIRQRATEATVKMMSYTGVPLKQVSQAEADRMMELFTTMNHQQIVNFARQQRPHETKRYAVVNVRDPYGVPKYFEKKKYAEEYRVWGNRVGGVFRTFDLDAVREQDESMLNAADVQPQIEVWHGSGAVFTKFDHSYMGTGQGSQVFGYGTYLTNNKDIGKDYAEMNEKVIKHVTHNGNPVSQRSAWDNIEGRVASFVAGANGNIEDAKAHIKTEISYAEDEINHFRGKDRKKFSETIERIKGNIRWYNEYLKAIDEGKWGYSETRTPKVLYRVEIPDDTGTNYLPWREPYHDSLPKMLAEKLGDEQYAQWAEEVNRLGYNSKSSVPYSGRNAYKALSKLLGSDEAASKLLSDIGYSGVKFPAGTIRGNGRGATNYVIFDAEDAKIVQHIQFMFESQSDSQEQYVGEKPDAVSQGTGQNALTPLSASNSGYKVKQLIHSSQENDKKLLGITGNGSLSFQKGQGGRVYGWTDGTGIFLTPLGMNPNSPMHEYTHIWDRYMQNHDPQLWKDMVKTLRKTAMWQQIRENPNYRSIWNDDDRMASEVHSRLTGARSEEEFAKAAANPDNKDADSIIKEVRDVIRRFWERLAQLFGFGRDRLEEFILMPLRDALEGFNPIEDVTSRKDILFQIEGGMAGESKPVRSLMREGSLFTDADFMPETKPSKRWRSITDMSDEDLLKAIGKKDGEERRRYIDEYDSRHEAERKDEEDVYYDMLESSNTTLDDAYDMYGSVFKKFKDGGYASPERTKMVAQIDALEAYVDYMKEVEAERRQEEKEKEEAATMSQPTGQKEKSRKEERRLSETEQRYDQQKAEARQIGYDLAQLKLRPLEKDETCRVERRYVENGMFSFTGKEKIESIDDVAYIFKQLEDAAIENTFLVLEKDGVPTIIHLATGTYTEAYAKADPALAAYSELQPDKVYFVHNHPSGNLQCSKADENVLKSMKAIFGNKLQPGIIIDTKSGKYGLFGDTLPVSPMTQNRMPEKTEGEMPLKVYSFSKQVFDADWNPETAFDASTAAKVAKFVSSHRLGEHKKMSLIVMNQAYKVTGNIFLPWNNFDDVATLQGADLITRYMNQMGGTLVTLYGNYDFATVDQRKIGFLNNLLKARGVYLADVIHIDKSAREMGMVGEPDRENDRAGEADITEMQSKSQKLPDKETADFVRMYRRATPEIVSINEKFNHEIDRLSDKSVLNLGRPSVDLLASGIEDKPMNLYGTKLISKINKHGYEPKDVKDLPLATHNPIAIFKGSSPNSFAILTEVNIKGNNVLVTLSTGKGNDIDFNIISSTYPKDFEKIMNWIMQDKALYYDKEKALDYLRRSAPFAGTSDSKGGESSIDALRINPVDHISTDGLNSAAKIVKDFNNPKLSEEKLRNIYGNFAETAEETADMLGGQKVVFEAESSEKGTLGWYDPNDNTVHVVLPEHGDVNEIRRTVCHEKLGHEGLVGLLGSQEKVNEFGQFVFGSASKDLRKRIMQRADDEGYGWDDPLRFSKGAQEVLADIAADGPRTADEFSLWLKVKHYLIRLLNRMGLRIRGLLNDHDLAYYVLKTGEALKRWNKLPDEEKTAVSRQQSQYDLMRSRRGKPRKRKDESMAQYLQRLREWERWKIAEEQARENNDPMPEADKVNEKWHEQFNRDVAEWRRSNNIPDDAEGIGPFPKRERDESPQAYAARVADYETQVDAWKDAPKLFDYLQRANDEYREAYRAWKERYGIREQESVDLGLYEDDPDRMPHIVDPEDLEADTRAESDLAEAVGIDMSADGARRHTKISIIERRKNLESSNAEDAIWIHNLVKLINEEAKRQGVDPKELREAMADIIEGTYFEDVLKDEHGNVVSIEDISDQLPIKMTGGLKDILDTIKDWYDEFYHVIEDAGLRNGAGYIPEGYVNHVWSRERSNPDAWKKYVENFQRTKSPNMRERVIETYREGRELGLVPKFDDIADILAYYSASNNEAVANRKFLDNLSFIVVEELNGDGEVVSVLPLLNSNKPNIAVADRYEMYHVPGVGDVWVLKDIKRSFANIFGTMRTSDIPDWLTKTGKVYDTVSSTAKKMELSFSAFHMGALTEVAMAQMRPDRAMKALFQYIIFDCAKAGTIPAYAHPEDFKLAASHLVQLGATQDYSASDVNNVTEKFREIVRELAENEGKDIRARVGKVGGLGMTPIAAALDYINKGMDKVLWNYLHDGLKIACFKMFAEQIDKRVEKEGLSADQREQLLDEAGQYVNDTFGGQYWELLNVSPALIKWLRRGFLSPDWLISTQRHFLANFGFGSLYNESGFINYVQYNIDNLKRSAGSLGILGSLGKEWAGIPRNENRRFRSKNAKQCYLLGVCGFFYVMMNAINAVFRAMDEQKEREKAEDMRKDNPGYMSPYELAYPDGMKWYDYTMLGNTIGQQTHLFLGRYNDGTEWYARWGKQFREFPELFMGRHGFEFPTPLMERMSGKANPVGRYLLYDLPLTVGMYGYRQPRETQEIAEKYGNTVALLAMTAKKFIPYSVPTQRDKEFKMFDLVMPSQKGFTRWKAVDFFKTYIQGGDMDGIQRTYNAAVMNGIDAEDCLNAAIATVKATQRKELSDGIVDLQSAMARYDAEKDTAEKKRLRRKIFGYLAEQSYRTFTRDEARELVEQFLSGTPESDNDINNYVKLATSSDVRDEYRLDVIRRQAKKFADEVKTEENESRRRRLEDTYGGWLEINDIIKDANKQIGRLKRQLGKGDDDKAIMDEIRDVRREAQQEVDKINAP